MIQDEFRWQALFQRTREPLFLLNRQRRILFVNQAWEELTGLSAAQVRGVICPRRRPSEPHSVEAVAHVLCPPPEVIHGQPGRARRLEAGVGPARRWWDLEFFPFRDEQRLLGVLGKVRVVAVEEPIPRTPLPDRLMALREGLAQRYSLDQLASGVPAVGRVADQVRLASASRVAVLIVGEPGTGKQWIARAIHHRGITREQTFAALDCLGLPSAALGSLLLDAAGLAHRPGMGTLYFREPGWLPRDLQARLHDFLEQCALAEEGPRLIAGCSTDPVNAAAAGQLVEELHFAWSTLTIAVPPLRARKADLPDLVERFLERIQSGSDPDSGRRVRGLSPEAMELIQSYAWPGNLRELYAVLSGACLRARGEHLSPAELPAYLRVITGQDRTPGSPPERSLPLDHLLEEAERRLIVLALQLARGNKSRAAEILAIWRPRLQRRMEALNIPDR